MRRFIGLHARIDRIASKSSRSISLNVFRRHNNRVLVLVFVCVCTYAVRPSGGRRCQQSWASAWPSPITSFPRAPPPCPQRRPCSRCLTDVSETGDSRHTLQTQHTQIHAHTLYYRHTDTHTVGTHGDTVLYTHTHTHCSMDIGIWLRQSRDTGEGGPRRCKGMPSGAM